MTKSGSTPNPQLSSRLRFFCLIGAAISLLLLLLDSPVWEASDRQSALSLGGLIFMCMLNLWLAGSPCSIPSKWARWAGVLITVAILLVTPLTIGLPFVHLIPWASAVSGLDLWKRRERGIFWIFFGVSAASIVFLLIYPLLELKFDLSISSSEQQSSESSSSTSEYSPEETRQTYNPRVFYNDKPIIYLYPKKTQQVDVRLKVLNGTLTATYPPYDFDFGGWRVIAEPDGTLLNLADNQTHSYLFWESLSTSPVAGDFSEGFAIRGNEIREFLANILPKIGLLPHEYNEFIVYWYPRLMNIPLMHIYFAGAEYDAEAPLMIEPLPDSILRVFMVVHPLDRPIELQPQRFDTFKRKGFTVVEWGGTLVSN